MNPSDQWDPWLAEVDSVQALAPEGYDDDSGRIRVKTLWQRLTDALATYEASRAVSTQRCSQELAAYWKTSGLSTFPTTMRQPRHTTGSAELMLGPAQNGRNTPSTYARRLTTGPECDTGHEKASQRWGRKRGSDIRGHWPLRRLVLTDGVQWPKLRSSCDPSASTPLCGLT
jgi:hypothetical protein